MILLEKRRNMETFYDDNKIQSEGCYLNGKKDGEWKYFKKDGSINKIEKWMLGKKHRK